MELLCCQELFGGHDRRHGDNDDDDDHSGNDGIDCRGRGSGSGGGRGPEAAAVVEDDDDDEDRDMFEDSDLEFLYMEGEPDKEPGEDEVPSQELDNRTVAYTPGKSSKGQMVLDAWPGSATKPASTEEADTAAPASSRDATTAILIEESPLKVKAENTEEVEMTSAVLQAAGSSTSLNSREDSQVAKGSPPSGSKKDKCFVFDDAAERLRLQKELAKLKLQLATRTNLVACCHLINLRSGHDFSQHCCNVERG